MENIFDYQRVVSGEKFVDREEELKTVINAMMQGENLILFSPRRLGKTSLLKEATRRIGNKKIVVYADLLDCTNEREISETIANAVIKAAYNKIEKAIIVVKEFITSSKPTVTLETNGIEVKFEFFQNEKTLKEILKMIEKIAEKKKKKIVVILDECQVITEIKKIESIFRSEMQQQEMVSYIFSGSKKHVLEAMIKDKSRPFYKQLRSLTIGPIPINEFNDFIKKGFTKVGGIGKEVIEEIHKFAQGNPQRTQQICFYLFSKALEGKRMTPLLVKEVVKEICLGLDKEFETEFNGIKNLSQRQIIKAMAIEDIKKPLSNRFISKYNLGSTSSVHSSLKSLVEKGILDEKYNFTDPLFKIWISSRHKGWLKA